MQGKVRMLFPCAVQAGTPREGAERTAAVPCLRQVDKERKKSAVLKRCKEGGRGHIGKWLGHMENCVHPVMRTLTHFHGQLTPLLPCGVAGAVPVCLCGLREGGREGSWLAGLFGYRVAMRALDVLADSLVVSTRLSVNEVSLLCVCDV